MLGNKGSRKFYRSGGTRGGQDQFKWEDVKSDKYRENYLGHSVLAPVGRWQKGKDLHWYAKSKTEQEVLLDEEKERMRQQDEDLIDEALGLKKKRRVDMGNDLDALDIKALLSRGGTERASEDIQRIQGLGAAPAKIHDHIEKTESSSMYSQEIQRLQQSQQEKQGMSSSSGGNERDVTYGSSSSSIRQQSSSSSSSSYTNNSESQPQSGRYGEGRYGEDRDEDHEGHHHERDHHERKAHKHDKKEKKEKSKKHDKDKDRDHHHHHKEDKESKSKKHKKEKDRKRDRSPSG